MRAFFEVCIRLILLDSLLDRVAELSECCPVNQRVLTDIRRDSIFAYSKLQGFVVPSVPDITPEEMIRAFRRRAWRAVIQTNEEGRCLYHLHQIFIRVADCFDSCTDLSSQLSVTARERGGERTSVQLSRSSAVRAAIGGASSSVL